MGTVVVFYNTITDTTIRTTTKLRKCTHYYNIKKMLWVFKNNNWLAFKHFFQYICCSTIVNHLCTIYMHMYLNSKIKVLLNIFYYVHRYIHTYSYICRIRISAFYSLTFSFHNECFTHTHHFYRQVQFTIIVICNCTTQGAERVLQTYS